MAQITVTYKDFEEMKAVARELLKDELNGKQGGEEKSIPYGQQIAPHFPNANVGQAPAPAPSAASEAAQGIPTTPLYPPPRRVTRGMTCPGRPMTLMDKGMQMQLQQLIQSYGVNSLVELPQDQYGNFATALRGMGAQI